MTVRDLTGEPQIKALTEFLTSFATPHLDESHVLIGQLSEMSLPRDGNDFCVFTPILQQRVGTTFDEWSKDSDTIILSEYVNVTYQIDCYSSDIVHARERAQTYELVARSFYGVNHFKKYGIDCLFAERLRNLSSLLDDALYVSRWSIELQLGYTKRIEVPQDYFNKVDVGVFNVDVSFNPNRKGK